MGCRTDCDLSAKQRHSALRSSSSCRKINKVWNKAFFILRQWEDGGVVFDRRTGYTYALDSATMIVFDVILNLSHHFHEPDWVNVLVNELPNMNESDLKQSLDHNLKFNIIA